MSNPALRPMCFVAMPFGRKPPPGKKKPLIDFDLIYGFIKRAVVDMKLECVRADFESTGGFIHRPMYERLLVAEYVIADLTLANPNVTYEVGVRHGSGAKATLLVCAEEYADQLPFDLKVLRVLTYSLDKNGQLSESAGKNLQKGLKERLNKAIAGELPPDNPILQVTSAESSGHVQHEKTDVFLKRMRYASEVGGRVHTVLDSMSSTEALNALKEIQNEVLEGDQVVSQLHTALVSIYLGYREKKAYLEMETLYEKLPKELQMTPVAIEQLAFAINRLAEEAAEAGDFAKARRLQKQALRRLDDLMKQRWSSETYGIAGRIYKGQAKAEELSQNKNASAGALNRAIEMYEKGFRLDPRDYYPGVNAVTLRLRRNSTMDLQALEMLVPAVRFSVERAPVPEDNKERYWQGAAKLELACADRDWNNAHGVLPDVVAIDVEDWYRETTIENLMIQKSVFAPDIGALKHLDEIISELKP